MRRFFLVLLLLLVAVVLVLLYSTEWLVSLGGRPEGARLERHRRSPQWANGTFRNRQQAPLTTSSNREMLRRQFFGDEQREPLRPIPVVTTRPANASPLRATWLGWATVLVEIDGRHARAGRARHALRRSTGCRGASGAVGRRFFFSGDTAYHDDFRTIGAQHGPFDLTLLKIGAYDETWESIDMDPEDAVRAHVELRGNVMLPVHWATFNLGVHAWREPPDRTLAAARKAGIALVVPRRGQAVDLTAPLPAVDVWWR